MKSLVFLLEEESATEMLKGVLPRILFKKSIAESDIVVKYIVFRGKQDLKKKLEHKLRGWRTPSVFLVMCDRDHDDCEAIKKALMKAVDDSGNGKGMACIRIACGELESFYLGDLVAVESGLGISNIARKQNEKKFREPDTIDKPSKTLQDLTQGKYQKVSGSRAIALHLKLDGTNRSHSFNVLIAGIERLLEKEH